ncbi:hypothetical protein ACIBFB_13705 [Nocardiopsis sp. NPDC050513]|uniref:hypothetical protein n=1 Tax=Nocardiopsis sp. NPDC050513 TaxID=3364338 RepID=UPI00378896BD
MSDPIDPDAIPIPQTRTIQLENEAARLRTIGGDFSDSGHDITSTWAGLSDCYSAPEAETLFAVLNPVTTKGEDLNDALTSAASALETFAATAAEIKLRMLTLQLEARRFLTSIEGDDDWDKGGWFGGKSDKAEELAALQADIRQATEEFTAAEIECANAITSLLPDGTFFRSADPDGSTEVGENEFVYGLTEIPADMETAWGPPATTDHHWWVDATHGAWDWTMGGVTDIAGMTGTYYEGQWGVPIVLFAPIAPFIRSQGNANAMNYREDMVTGIARLSGFYRGEGPAPATAEDSMFDRPYAWEWDGWYIPESREEWWGNVKPGLIEMAHGVYPWTENERRPGYAQTQGAINVAGVFMGGASLIKGGLGGLRALGHGDFNLSALSHDELTDVMGGGTLLPNGSTGNVPRPDLSDTSEAHWDSEQLDSVRDTLDELAAQQSPPPPEAPWVPEAQESPGRPPNRGSGEAAPTSDSDAEVPAASDADTPAQDPTVQEVQDAQTLAEILRENPELAEIMTPELAEEFRAMDPDSPWETGVVRDPEMAMAGGGSDTTVTNSSGATPVDTPTGGSADFTTGGDGTIPVADSANGGRGNSENTTFGADSQGSVPGDAGNGSGGDGNPGGTSTSAENPQPGPPARPSDGSSEQRSPHWGDGGVDGDRNVGALRPPGEVPDTADHGLEPTGRPETVGSTKDDIVRYGALGDDFRPDIFNNPQHPFTDLELSLAELRFNEGRHVVALEEGRMQNVPGADALERSGPNDPGRFVEYKTALTGSANNIQKQIKEAFSKFDPNREGFHLHDADIVIDARSSNVETVLRATRSRLSQMYNRGELGRISNVGRLEIYTRGTDGELVNITFLNGRIYQNNTLVASWEGNSWQ